MSHPRSAVHRTILVVDVEGFGDQQRTNPNQIAVREGMYGALRSAFDAIDISWDGCDIEDRGDGVFVLAQPEVPKASFVEHLPQALAATLRQHNRQHPREERIRLRMALHAGEINYDQHGVTAKSINLAFRLLDAKPLKDALAGSSGVLALIVSQWFYEEVVQHSQIEDASTYRSVAIDVKETKTTAWISLPDQPYPATDVSYLNPPVMRPATELRGAERPQQLPARPGTFTGRARELRELTNLADQQTSMPIAVVAGMGGIGKTWLALQWAHENRDRFPDGQLYVNLRGFDPSGTPVAPAAAVRGFLDALRVPASLIPVDNPDAQAALYRSLVANSKMLILLDNARDSGQVIPLLPGSSGCMVLITSREHLTGLVTAHGARPLPLNVLDDESARELLVRRLGPARVHAEQVAVDELVGYCAGLPLALGIVAAHAATHSDFPLGSLAAELGQTSARLDALDGMELDSNLRAVLSWSYQALSPETAEMFRLLGGAPGPDISEQAAAVLAGLAPDTAARRLRLLEKAHLVQRYLPTRYRMHDLVRLYAADRAETDGKPDREDEALRRLLSYYLHASYAGERLLYPHRKQVDLGKSPVEFDSPEFTDDTSILKWFDVEHACLMAAQATAVKRGWHELVWQLAWTLHGFLWRRGHLQDRMMTWRAGLRATQQLDDPAIEGLAHRLLGQAYAMARRDIEAKEHLYQALDLARKTGDTHGEARAFYDLTLVWRDTDDEMALKHATESYRLFQELDSPVWEAEALDMMGKHQAKLGFFAEAEQSCLQAFELFRQNGNRQGEAVTLDSLGYIAHHSGRYEEALSYFHRSLALCRDLGATYYEADTQDHLGHAYAALGRVADARRAWRRALTLNRTQHRTRDADRIQQQLELLDYEAS